LFFLQNEPILIPNEVRGLQIVAVSLHARLKQTYDVRVIWVLCEREASAVVHKLAELLWLVLAKFFHSYLLLLFLNVGVLFLFGSSWKSLPRKRSFEEVKQDVTNGLQVISS